jgi:hypothetical protein
VRRLEAGNGQIVTSLFSLDTAVPCTFHVKENRTRINVLNIALPQSHSIRSDQDYQLGGKPRNLEH